MASERDKALAAITKALGHFTPAIVKALVYIAEGRVTITSGNEWGIRYQVVGTAREPYHCAVGIDKRGNSITTCTCYQGAEIRPTRPRCSHVAVGRLLFRR